MKRFIILMLLIIPCGLGTAADQRGSTRTNRGKELFRRFLPPDDWRAKFWNSPEGRTLRSTEPSRIAEMVPKQAGLRFCRCPSCGASDADEPLHWSIEVPSELSCQICRKTFPNDAIPAKDKEKKIPEDTISVDNATTHHYAYHVLDADDQRFDGERAYLDARKDYELREILAKACFYAAAGAGMGEPCGDSDALIAAVILIKFAQVYPLYALHQDQPGRPKSFEPAHRPPPYSPGYMTAKWDWSGALDVPLNLLIAYAMIRDSPAIDRAAIVLNVTNPRNLIENDLFRASAIFSLDQPEEIGESALLVDRGALAVGRLLEDQALVGEATRRIDRFLERGFYYDGLWRGGTASSQFRILELFNRWIEPLMADDVGGQPSARPRDAGARARSMLDLARSAASTMRLGPIGEIKPERSTWPPELIDRRVEPVDLLGGSAVARLSTGQGDHRIAVQLRSLGSAGEAWSRRQSLRLEVGGRELLSDLDEQPHRDDGWDRASASHNTVVIDRRNHLETIERMREPSTGGNCLFYASDPDFQVVAMDDPRAYPTLTSAGSYRQILMVSSGPTSSYAVSVFDVEGGQEHDQLWHGPSSGISEWEVSIPTQPGPKSLLPPGIPFLPRSPVEDGRWFVQSFGAFRSLSTGSSGRPSFAELAISERPRLRLHFMGEGEYALLSARTPAALPGEDVAKASLIVRRTSSDRQTAPLRSRFVTLMEPLVEGRERLKVGRLPTSGEMIGLVIETADGPEHLLINLRPGVAEAVKLADGRDARTDALVVRVRRNELMIAGGRFAKVGSSEIHQDVISGRILASERYLDRDRRGWFEVEGKFAGIDRLTSRSVIVRHGDAVAHAWTLRGVEEVPGNRTRLYLREEPGFLLESVEKQACYYQYPGSIHPGPHSFAVNQISRKPIASPASR